MASINTGGGGGGKKARINTRVDFTPMVDMMMLLLTFFMFCTTLSKPQVLSLVMPIPDDKILNEPDPDTKKSQAVTLILGQDNKVYYYTGLPVYDDYTTLKEAAYPTDKDNGFREILMEKNADIMGKMRELKREDADKKKKMSDEVFAELSKEIKSNKDGAVVRIMPTEWSTYENLVDALDEMAICDVGRYAVLEMGDAENFLLENYFTKGAHGQSVTAPAKAPAKAKAKAK